jgi:hypothetical protein
MADKPDFGDLTLDRKKCIVDAVHSDTRGGFNEIVSAII